VAQGIKGIQPTSRRKETRRGSKEDIDFVDLALALDLDLKSPEFGLLGFYACLENA